MGNVKVKCVVSQCSRNAIPGSPYKMCSFCTQVVYAMLHALPHVQVQRPPQPQQPKPKIFIPGGVYGAG